MVKVNRLYNRIEPFSALFWALYSRIYCDRWPARQPGIPQPWYWHGTVRQGSVRVNLSEEATPSSPLPLQMYILFGSPIGDPPTTFIIHSYTIISSTCIGICYDKKNKNIPITKPDPDLHYSYTVENIYSDKINPVISYYWYTVLIWRLESTSHSTRWECWSMSRRSSWKSER